MPHRHPLKTAFLALASVTIQQANVSACCLTDWLYGRQPAYAVAGPTPYAVGYAPISQPVYTAGYAPVVTAPVPVAGGLPLSGPRVLSARPPYAVQRPAYGAVPLNNPSVYTGQPVVSGYRGVATPGNSFYGTGNAYPNNFAAASPSPVTSFRPGFAPAAPLNSSVVSLPIAPAYRTPVRSGLARFFDSLLGTGYRTSYYTAPITYYRPATTLNPLTGSATTVQQACTSTVQQLQRTPFSTFQPANGFSQPIASSSCQSPLVNPSPYASVPASGFMPNQAGGVVQAGDLQPLGQPSLSPSTSFQGSNLTPLTGAQPNLVSPNSYDAGSGYGNSVSSPSDQQPLEAPELRSARPASPSSNQPRYEYRYDVQPSDSSQGFDSGSSQRSGSSPRGVSPGDLDEVLEGPANGNGSYYQRSRHEIERDRRDLENLTTQRPFGGRSAMSSLGNAEADASRTWHRVRPIPAPENYRNPFATPPRTAHELPSVSGSDRVMQTSFPESAPEVSRSRMTAPDLPPLPQPEPSYRRDVNRASQPFTRPSYNVPVREVSAPRSVESNRERQPKIQPLAKPATESGWYSLSK